MATACYGSYGVVSIVETAGNLSKIHTNADDEFWVRTEKLKSTTAPQSNLVESTDDEFKKFVDYLNRVGYALRAEVRTDGVEQVEQEYAEWCGESLPNEFITIYDNRPLAREWRLKFYLYDKTNCPFPISTMGTNGGKPSKEPKGLVYNDGRAVVQYASIIEKLVRAGLRVQ